MLISETDYFRDAIAMAAVDLVTHEQLFTAVLMARTGNSFNAAIHATIQLNDIVRQHEQGNSGRNLFPDL